MRQLVRDQRIALEIEMCARVVQRAVGLRRRRRVFHSAENKIADRHLRILGVRVGHADHALEKLDHLRRVAKRAARIVLAPRRNVVGDRSIARALSDQRELTGRQRDQIGRMRHLMTPMKGAGLVRGIGRRPDQRAVGNRCEFFRHRRDNLAGGPAVRIVVAWKPVARIFILALRPRLTRLVRVTSIWADEIKSAPWLTRVIDRNFDFLARTKRPRHRNLQFLVGCLERRRLSAHADSLDLQLGSIELKPLERPGNRGQSMRRRARNLFRVEVERDFELDVTDIRGAIPRPLRLDMLRLKRATPTRERDGKRLTVAQIDCQLIEKSRLMHGRNVMNRRRPAQSRNRKQCPRKRDRSLRLPRMGEAAALPRAAGGGP